MAAQWIGAVQVLPGRRGCAIGISETGDVQFLTSGLGRCNSLSGRTGGEICSSETGKVQFWSSALEQRNSYSPGRAARFVLARLEMDRRCAIFVFCATMSCLNKF